MALGPLSVFSACFAVVQFGAPFSDNAVLQRGMPVPVWGTATQEIGRAHV